MVVGHGTLPGGWGDCGDKLVHKYSSNQGSRTKKVPPSKSIRNLKKFPQK